jgi:hypothetical protein
VYGSINVFQRLPKIQSIYLGRTQCAGDVNAFAMCKGLEHLTLNHCCAAKEAVKPRVKRGATGSRIVGDVLVFDLLPRLVELDLSGANVFSSFDIKTAALGLAAFGYGDYELPDALIETEETRLR